MTLPLAGRSVVITRSQQQNASLRQLLEDSGANVIEMPLIAISEPDDEGRQRDAVLQKFYEFDWIVITSPNGAERVARFITAARAAGDQERFPRFAVVGAATQRSLGVVADLVAEPSTAKDLVNSFPTGNGTVLVVQGNLADAIVTSGLEHKGWQVTDVVAYRTVQIQPDSDVRELALQADALLLASSSAASAWCEAFGTQTPEVVVVIGPSTAKTASDLGLNVTAVSAEHTLVGLVDTTEQIFEVR